MKKAHKTIILLCIVNSVFAQIESKTYILSKYILIGNNDSLIYYSRDSLENIWDLQYINFHFNTNNTYSGNSINSTNKTGTWLVSDNTLFLDKDTSNIVFMDSYKIVLRDDIVFNYASEALQGHIITELINYIYSVKSGSWNDRTIWSCSCIPNENDNVLIRKGTKVTLTNEMGPQSCKHLTVELGAIFDNSSVNFVADP